MQGRIVSDDGAVRQQRRKERKLAFAELPGVYPERFRMVCGGVLGMFKGGLPPSKTCNSTRPLAGIRHSPSYDALQHDFRLDLPKTPVAVKVEQGKYLLELSKTKTKQKAP